MMPPTIKKTQLTGWLKNAPTRERLQAEVSGELALRVVSLADTSVSSQRRKICWYSFFFSANFFASRSYISTN
jgi:hypothetical protein